MKQVKKKVQVDEPKLVREQISGHVSIKLIQGNIAMVGGGVLMSPTNCEFSRNSGLTTYIVDSAGSRIMNQILAWKDAHEEGLSPGDIVVTGAGALPAVHILHTCIPPFSRDDPEPLVRMFVLKALEKIDELQLESLILPCLPKTAYGFTPEQCAYGYFSSVIDYLNSHGRSSVKEVKIVTLEKQDTMVFELEMDRRFGVKEKKSFFSFGRKKKEKNAIKDIEMR